MLDEGGALDLRNLLHPKHLKDGLKQEADDVSSISKVNFLFLTHYSEIFLKRLCDSVPQLEHL